MITLAFDPGAARMGWAAFDEGAYLGSGLFTLAREKDESFQPYKLRVIETYTNHAIYLFTEYSPGSIVAEIVPAMGFERSVQNQLAQAAITSVMAVMYFYGLAVDQIGATTVKKAIGGSGKASKVKVRNGVIKMVPELKPRVKDWVKVFDEPDAVAIGLAYLGVTVKP